ncbi:anti-sigma factor [Polaromonas sp.]|uniref:anti-sigma factor family protein n=1 Tax=Polaromonas sp. TaxID=1869339 RepID=UPI0017E8D3D8|nr:anti-sigma factor [Polaromonas sp.]NMM06803.1 anti-sigma factor [Polaromonas sp.]
MDPRPADKPSLDELNALLDGQLPAAARAAVQARAAADPAARETLAVWQAQRDALRELHRALLDEPIPETLLAAAQHSARARQQREGWWRWGGMAASVTMAFALGWLAHGGWLGVRPGDTAQTLAASQNRAGREFVHQAALAHAVYAPELRHPVEVAAAQQEHLVQWLSKRLVKPLKVPSLTAQGYSLMGGRLLPGESGARAQFMFENTAGVRVTLYLGAVDGRASTASTAAAAANAKPAVPASQDTAFRYSSEGPVPGFYWVDQGFGYAMSGPVSREELMKLAELVYQQL